MDLTLSPRRARRVLLGVVAALALVGLGAELCDHLWAPPWAGTWVPFLSLSYEQNLPTWWAVCLHALSALLAALHAGRCRRAGAPYAGRWATLAAALAYVSLDELAELHESAGGWVETGGLLYFDWILPAAVLTLALGLWLLPLVFGLPLEIRRRVIAAGAIFVTGALLMEMPLGYWTERAGADTLGYALIDWVEETLELLGSTLLLLALGDHLAAALLGVAPDKLPARLRLRLLS